MKPEVAATIERIGKHPDAQLAQRVSQKIKPSRAWVTLKMDGVQDAPLPDGTGRHPMEIWSNDLYDVTVRRFLTGWPFGGGMWAQIGMYCRDGEPRHDWRDMQRIKNDVVAPDWEAVELFPSEDRLLDPSNYYTLFAAPKIPLGIHEGRRIVGPDKCLAPQRAWHPTQIPKDIL